MFCTENSSYSSETRLENNRNLQKENQEFNYLWPCTFSFSEVAYTNIAPLKPILDLFPRNVKPQTKVLFSSVCSVLLSKITATKESTQIINDVIFLTCRWFANSEVIYLCSLFHGQVRASTCFLYTNTFFELDQRDPQ